MPEKSVELAKTDALVHPTNISQWLTNQRLRLKSRIDAHIIARTLVKFSNGERSGKNWSFNFDRYQLQELIKTDNRVIILCGAGAGKSSELINLTKQIELTPLVPFI